MSGVLLNTTAVPVPMEQTPLPYAVIVQSNEEPSAKALVAMFRFEEDRDAYVEAWNDDASHS